MCVCVCVRACVCVCVCVFVLHYNSKSSLSRNMKFEHIVVYENISEKLNIGHCRTKVKVTVRLRTFFIYHNTNCQVPLLNFSTSQEAYIKHVCLSDTNK